MISSHRKYLPLLLMIGLSISLVTSLSGQRILRDTFSFMSYGSYCEQVRVCECLVPDTTYMRLQGRFPDETKEVLPYVKSCHPLIIDSYCNLITYKDFALFIGSQEYKYAYPQYSYYIKKATLLEHIKDIKLYISKSNEYILIHEIELSDGNQHLKIDLKKDTNLPKLKEKLQSWKKINLKVSSFQYPEMGKLCWDEMFILPTIRFIFE